MTARPWILASLGLACLVQVVALAPLAGAEEPLRDAIDTEIRGAWEREHITPAPPCDDAAFLRRVYLDLAGIIPGYEAAQKFLEPSGGAADPERRARLIDELLDSPRYAVHQADVWDMVFFGRNPQSYDAPKRAGFQKWLSEAFAKNLPYDELARVLLKAEGNTAEQGAPMYLVQYDRRPEDAAMAVSQTLLGVQLQCARCHDHPYEAWKQRDFYGLAAFFARLVIVRNGKADNLDKVYVAEMNTGEIRFAGPAATATPGKQGEAVRPKFLVGDPLDEPDLSAQFKDEKRPADGKEPSSPQFSRKDQLAAWVTAPDNPYFARAAVNRVWAQLMGRGLVHPVDNMSASNAASHPALLDKLAQAFTAHRFDLKWLIREIVSSRTYQLASDGEVTEAAPRWFQRAGVRPLSAEELLESWRVASGYDEVVRLSEKKPEGRFHGVTWDYVRQFFGEPVNGVGDFQGGLQEHLYLNNGELGRLISSEKGSLCEAIAKSDEPWEARVDRLYLSVLTRRPSDVERTRFVEHLSVKEGASDRLRDAIWTLMTCSEFRFNK